MTMTDDGRSMWGLTAFYLGLASLLVVPAPVALVVGIIAIVQTSRTESKRGKWQAIFGTVMGGLIAGNAADSSGALSLIRKGGYSGVAPRANVIAVKVAGRSAAVDVSTVLQAMHWVAAYRNQYNIRVLNLSLGRGIQESSSTDPLCAAVDRACGS